MYWTVKLKTNVDSEQVLNFVMDGEVRTDLMQCFKKDCEYIYNYFVNAK